MILQSLVQLYDDLVQRNLLAQAGWSPVKISYALCLDLDGKLIQIVPQFTSVPSGKKTVLRPEVHTLPAAVKRTSGILPNFLWDNSSYLLGIRKFDEKKDEKKYLPQLTVWFAVRNTSNLAEIFITHFLTPFKPPQRKQF